MFAHYSFNHFFAKFLFLLLILSAGIANAQETSSGIRGTITDSQGAPISGAEVTVRNEDSGLTRSTITNDSGEYNVRNLPIGNNYSVSVSGDEINSKRIEDIGLNLGKIASISFGVESAVEGSIEEITVLGEAIATVDVADGPSSVFSLSDLEDAPAINRSITDIIRSDPRIFVNESNNDAVFCAGKNPRFNSITVDGLKLNDSFGLNANGYPTERVPFSFDAIQQIAVELAPFDVTYGGFSACNINAAVKSGSNEFHGSLFYDYTDDSFRADSLEGDPIIGGEFDETRYGLTLGGPIIQDKLFFFASYEKLEGANLFDRGAIGSNAVDEIDITQAELDEIVQIANDVYQYDPGVIPTSAPNEDEKILVKLDWNISDQHRASFTYNYNDGFNIVESDGDSNEFEFSNHLYERGAELEAYSLSLYSDWTDRFTTEVRVAKVDLDNRQISVGGTDFGEIRIETDDVDVYIGGDDSRQSNDLNYSIDSIILKGLYDLDDHQLTFGYERENLDIFNLFIQHSETEIRFDGIENFRNGFADSLFYNNAITNNPIDAASDWGYAIDTLYFQDEFFINNRTSIVAGLRFDRYSSSDNPAENPEFVESYGFSNDANLDGIDLIQPRLSVTFDLSDSTTLRGGAGLYSGGNPNVWISNAYGGSNVLANGQRGRDFGYTDGTRSLFDDDVVYAGLEEGVPNGPGYGVPSELFNAVTTGEGSNFEVVFLDPDFDIPTELKLSIGATHVTEGDYVISADALFTKAKDSAIILRADIDQVGTTAEGYPIYESNRLPAFVTTNSSTDADSLNLSIGVSKTHDNGVNWSLGYSYNDAEDISPMGSSVAFSNYVNRTFFDPQEEVASTSNFSIKHRITGTATWRKAFFGDNNTTFSIYGSYFSGSPYSLAFDGTADPFGFTPFLDFADNVLEPGTRRNGEESSSWTKFDIKIEQEFPGFSGGHKASAFLVIDNFTNLLNDDWGVLYETNFNVANIDDETPESRQGDPSRYEIRFGIQYDF